jgi:hypothetical protein
MDFLLRLNLGINLLLGWLAAALVDLWRSWQIGVPDWSRARPMTSSATASA